VQRRAGIKAGDRVQFKTSGRSIVITVQAPTYKPTNAELTAIRKGETEIARGQHVSLAELLNALAPDNRKGGSKTSRRVSR
jgi:hypothetical protein